MGGLGSTRWGWHKKKRLVEECFSIDIGDFAREGILDNAHYRGISIWYNKLTGEVITSMNVETELLLNGVFVVHLKYKVLNFFGEEDVDIPVVICETKSYLRGKHRWFLCPLMRDGQWCARRMRKLYRPSGEKYYGCRECHQLTYRKCQEHKTRSFDWFKYI